MLMFGEQGGPGKGRGGVRLLWNLKLMNSNPLTPQYEYDTVQGAPVVCKTGA